MKIFRKFFSLKSTIFTVVLTMVTLNAVPVFGAGGAAKIEDPAADATNKIAQTATEHRWFYWPGWAFALLTFLTIALIAFAYYRSVLGPKYRGKKVQS